MRVLKTEKDPKARRIASPIGTKVIAKAPKRRYESRNRACIRTTDQTELKIMSRRMEDAARAAMAYAPESWMLTPVGRIRSAIAPTREVISAQKSRSQAGR